MNYMYSSCHAGILSHFFMNYTYFSSGISYPSSSNPFFLLIHSPWLLVLSLTILFILSVFNLYLWKNIHFSWSNCIIFLLIYILFIISFHSLSSPTLGSWPGEGFYLPDPSINFFKYTSF